jgi:hypothetical protein
MAGTGRRASVADPWGGRHVGVAMNRKAPCLKARDDAFHSGAPVRKIARTIVGAKNKFNLSSVRNLNLSRQFAS